MLETELMSFSDIADEAQLPIRTVYYLHQTGKGPKSMTIGRHLRVRRSDFDQWLNSLEN